ncbi:MAG: DMT family transporter [Paracoccus sp. (in: a-proteobacteria)]|uniref:DMT family transporter n=1 Tax=Paracoccus sp. TaxID=267 RepID=UPI0026E0891A|nr:DMT family transporter [Paracoccus sp. (in: a-proteobacteria)]MDO5620741.1 DMT family transporter [Paracoccus sp. (in: a-proteobacteria)]
MAKPVTAPVEPGDNLRGAGLMCLCMTFFTTNDTVMKFVAQDLPLFQSIALRGMAVMLCLALVGWWRGGLSLRVPRQDFGALAGRTVGEVGSTIAYLVALTHMAIGDLSALMQSLPLVIMLSAALFFGEKLGWRRLLAVGIGFAGVMMILRPADGTFDIWSLLGLVSVAMIVLRDLATRKLSSGVGSLTIAFYAALSVTLMGLAVSVGEGWQAPTLGQAGLLILAGVFLTVGYLTAVAVMRVGEISFVAPFRYVSLVVAIFWGLVIFGEWPDLWTWAGAALVVGAGIYSIWREGRVRR